jgi:hypothetical protein
MQGSCQRKQHRAARNGTQVAKSGIRHEKRKDLRRGDGTLPDVARLAAFVHATSAVLFAQFSITPGHDRSANGTVCVKIVAA